MLIADCADPRERFYTCGGKKAVGPETMMAESLSQDAPTLGTPKRFAFSLAAMLMAVSVFALSLGAAKARDIGTGILVGLLAAAICMLVRGKKAAGSVLGWLGMHVCLRPGSWVVYRIAN